MFEKLGMYLRYDFVQNAVIVCVLVALCASLLGVTLVLKRFSFIGDGLSHVAFGAMAVAAVVNLADDMILILPVTILSAVLLLRSGQRAKVKGDAAVAVISVTSLAFGYLIMNLSSKSNVSGDVCTTLFGSTSILTLNPRDVRICIALAAMVVAVFVLLYHRIFSVTFDETFAKATGTNTDAYNLVISIVIAVIIVLAMKLVGSLLITALVIFPALSTMRLFRSFKMVTCVAALLSVVGASAGLAVSILHGTPVGSTIVAADFVIFVVCCLLGRGLGRA